MGLRRKSVVKPHWQAPCDYTQPARMESVILGTLQKSCVPPCRFSTYSGRWLLLVAVMGCQPIVSSTVDGTVDEEACLVSTAQASFKPARDIATGSVRGVSAMDAGDLDGDGLGDVVVAEGGKHAGGRKTFAWFKAPATIGGSWTRYNINNSAPLKPFLGSVKLADMDKDGDLDVVLTSDNHSGSSSAMKADVFVFVNPGPSNVKGTWSFHKVNTSELPLFHINDLEIADMDGDGKKDIICRSLTPNQIHIFFQNGISSYTKKSINTDIADSEGLGVGRLDGDNLPDITFTGVWLKSPSNPRSQNYTRLNIDSNFKNKNQNSKEAVGDIDGDGLNDVVIGPAEAFRGGGNHHLAWYKNPGNTSSSNWTKTIIKSVTNNNHTVKLADIDDDNDLDVLVGIPWANNVAAVSVLVYYNGGSGNYSSTQVVASGKGLYSGVAYDLDEDGDLDIVGQNTYAGTSKPYVYENLLSATPPINQAPTAKAGANQTIDLAQGQNTTSVTLSASESSDLDGTIVAYRWTGSPNPDDVISPHVDLGIGTHHFTLEVEDNDGAKDTDTVSITINPGPMPNEAPTAKAGANQTIDLAQGQTTTSVILTASASSDSDGTLVAYRWTGSPNPEDVVSPRVNLGVGTYVFTLEVEDNEGAKDTDTVSITINPAPTPNKAPTADAGVNQTIDLVQGQTTVSVTLSASGSSDSDGSIVAYRWTGSPIPDDVVDPRVSLGVGRHVFTLEVEDNDGAKDRDTVSITVHPAPRTNEVPTADAGMNQTIQLASDQTTISVTLDASESDDSDGAIVAYRWTGSPTPDEVVSPRVSLGAGRHVFTLEVEDNDGAKDTDTVAITVNPVPTQNRTPTADAGVNRTIELAPGQTTIPFALDASRSADPDGTIVAYRWSGIRDPEDRINPVVNLSAGSHVFTLEVEDNDGAKDTDTISITVVSVDNAPVLPQACPR